MADAQLASLPGFTVVSNVIEKALEKKVNDLKIWTLQLSNKVAEAGDTVTAHYVSSVPTATAKTSAGYVAGDFGLTAVSVSLGEPLYIEIPVSETEFVKVSDPAGLESTIGDTIGRGLAKKMEDTAMALITPTNFTVAISAGASTAFTFGKYRQLVAEGNKAGFNDVNVILNSDYIAKIEDSAGYYARTSNGNFDDGSKLVRSDRLPTANSLVGVVADKSAIVCASRALPAVEAGNVQTVVRQTESGLPIRYMKYYKPETGKWYFRGEVFFNAAKGNPSGLQRVVGA